MPPDFRFCPPDFFLTPHGFFFKLVFLGGKNVEICNFGQKKPSDFGEDLCFFCFFFGDHLLFGGKIAISARKIFGFRRRPFFFFWEITCFLAEKLRFRREKAFGFRRRPFFLEITCFLARKSLRISAKTFAPLILILLPDLVKLATPLRLSPFSLAKKSWLSAKPGHGF